MKHRAYSLSVKLAEIFYLIIFDRYFRAFGAIFFVCFFWFGAAYIHIGGGGWDYWQHLSAIRAVSSNVLDPPPLFFDAPYEVHLYTPYQVFWGAVMALGELGLWTVISIASLTNLLVFAWACHLTARYILKDSRLDFVLIMTLVLFWRAPVWWSGIYSAGQLTLQASYPSFLALGLTMLIGAVYFEPKFRNAGCYMVLSVGIAIVFLVHPITSIFLLLFLAVKVTMAPGHWLRNGTEAVWAPIFGVAAGFFWPYFSVPVLVFGTASQSGVFGGFDVFYNNPVGHIWPAVLGLLALYYVRKSSHIRFLSVLLAVVTLIYGANYILHGLSILGRIYIFMTVLLHLLVVAGLAAGRASRLAPPLVLGFVVISLLGVQTQGSISANSVYGPHMDFDAAVPLGTHAASTQYRDIERFGREIGGGQSSAIVMAPLKWAHVVAALTGYNVVGVGKYAPTMPDFQDRADAVNRFYDAATSIGERRDILRRFNVNYILIANGDPAVQIDEELTAVVRGSRFSFFTANVK